MHVLRAVAAVTNNEVAANDVGLLRMMRRIEDNAATHSAGGKNKRSSLALLSQQQVGSTSSLGNPDVGGGGCGGGAAGDVSSSVAMLAMSMSYQQVTFSQFNTSWAALTGQEQSPPPA